MPGGWKAKAKKKRTERKYFLSMLSESVLFSFSVVMFLHGCRNDGFARRNAWTTVWIFSILVFAKSEMSTIEIPLIRPRPAQQKWWWACVCLRARFDGTWLDEMCKCTGLNMYLYIKLQKKRAEEPRLGRFLAFWVMCIDHFMPFFEVGYARVADLNTGQPTYTPQLCKQTNAVCGWALPDRHWNGQREPFLWLWKSEEKKSE